MDSDGFLNSIGNNRRICRYVESMVYGYDSSNYRPVQHIAVGPGLQRTEVEKLLGSALALNEASFDSWMEDILEGEGDVRLALLLIWLPELKHPDLILRDGVIVNKRVVHVMTALAQPFRCFQSQVKPQLRYLTQLTDLRVKFPRPNSDFDVQCLLGLPALNRMTLVSVAVIGPVLGGMNECSALPISERSTQQPFHSVTVA